MEPYRGIVICVTLVISFFAESPVGEDVFLKLRGWRKAREGATHMQTPTHAAGGANPPLTPTYAADPMPTATPSSWAPFITPAAEASNPSVTVATPLPVRDLGEDWGCGPSVMASPSGVITSPNYPSNYSNEVYCDWAIEAPEGQVVHLSVVSLDLEYHRTCHYDSLGLSNSSDPYDGFFLCGSRTCDYVSESNVLHVSFYSDYSITGRGFNATYQMVEEGAMATDECRPQPTYTIPPAPASTTQPEVDCGETYLTETSGVIMSPNFPGSYPDDSFCQWTIEASAGQVIVITVTTLEIELHDTCAWDGLMLDDGQSPSNDRVLCGVLEEPCEFRSASGLLQLAFRSDGSVTAGGFSLSYQMVDAATSAQAQECGGVHIPNYITPIAFTPPTDPEVCVEVILAAPSGTITYPSTSGNYPNLADCDWTIQVDDGEVVRLSLTWMDIEEHVNCIYDWLSFSDPLTSDEETFMCGGTAETPCEFVTSGNVARVGFHSDSSVTGGGFTLAYQAATAGTQDGNICA